MKHCKLMSQARPLEAQGVGANPMVQLLTNLYFILFRACKTDPTQPACRIIFKP